MDWMDLTTCEVQTYAGTCEHTDLTKEPYLSVWATRLTESLDGVAHNDVDEVTASGT
jgi:hypothetical protein